LQNKDFEHDLESPQWAYRELNRAHCIANSAVFAELGLKDVGQPLLLFVLSDMRDSGRTCTQKELADILKRSPSTVAISVRSLERRGYVHRTVDENDKRRNYVEISELGLEIADRCRRAFDRIDAAMYAGFSPEEIKAVSAFFNRMNANLTALSSGEEHEETTEDDKCL